MIMKKFDDVIINKIESIKKCVERAREEYVADRKNFSENFSRQDAALMNIQRGCEQAIDLANYLLRQLNLGIPMDSRDSFNILAKEKIINNDLAKRLGEMVGFRNIIVHEYQKINFNIIVAVLTKDADDLLEFGKVIKKRYFDLEIRSKIANIDFENKEVAEKDLLELIDECFKYYLDNKSKTSEFLNNWRRLKIGGAIYAIAIEAKWLRLCATELKLFFEEDNNISKDNIEDSKTMSEDAIFHDISILKSKIK